MEPVCANSQEEAQWAGNVPITDRLLSLGTSCQALSQHKKPQTWVSPVVLQVKPLTDTRQGDRGNGSCLISATISSWIKAENKCSAVKRKGKKKKKKREKERKLSNFIKNAGGFLEQRSSHQGEKWIPGQFLQTCPHLTGLMFCLTFRTVVFRWTVHILGV